MTKATIDCHQPSHSHFFRQLLVYPGTCSPIFVAERIFQKQDRNSGRKQCDKIGDQKGTGAVFINHGRIPDEVSESDGRSHRGENKTVLGSPLFALHPVSPLDKRDVSTSVIPYSPAKATILRGEASSLLSSKFNVFSNFRLFVKLRRNSCIVYEKRVVG